MLRKAIVCLTIVALMIFPTTALAGSVPAERTAWTKFPLTYKGHATTNNTYAIQHFLIYYDSYCFSEIYGNGGVDGIFGTHTTNAVKRFQTKNGLQADGQVGPQTWGKIYDCLYGPTTTALDGQPEVGYVYYWHNDYESHVHQSHRKKLSTGEWQTYDKNYNWVKFGN